MLSGQFSLSSQESFTYLEFYDPTSTSNQEIRLADTNADMDGNQFLCGVYLIINMYVSEWFRVQIS